MLYEVITRLFIQHDAGAACRDVREKHVITSYSIHYTKLYDALRKKDQRPRRHAYGVREPSRLPETAKLQSHVPPRHQTDGRGSRSDPTPGYRIELRSGCSTADPRGWGSRITSYNVCYTKLLRTMNACTLVLIYDQEARTQNGMIKVVSRMSKIDMPSTPRV